MTVKELKKFLESCPDEMECYTYDNEYSIIDPCEPLIGYKSKKFKHISKEKVKSFNKPILIFNSCLIDKEFAKFLEDVYD